MRILKILALVSLGLVVLLACAGFVYKRKADQDWKALNTRVDAVQARLDREDWERAPLDGDPNEGEAFEHYQRALEQMDELAGPRPKATLGALRAATAEERADYDDYLRDASPALEELRLGAHAARARLELDWEGEEMSWETGMPDWPILFAPSARALAETAYLAFLVELTDGRHAEALAVLLDSLQFARDLAAPPMLSEGRTGVLLLSPSWLDTFGTEGGWALLPEEQLDLWIDALATVDESLETVGSLVRVDAALNVRGMEAFMTRATRGPFVGNLPLGPLASFAMAVLKNKTNEAHHLLFDFEAEYLAAFEREPLRAPCRVIKKYERLGSFAEGYVEVPLERYNESVTERLRALVRFRLLRHALALQAGRKDAPQTGRLGLPIHAEVEDGMRHVFLDRRCGTYIGLSIPLPPVAAH